MMVMIAMMGAVMMAMMGDEFDALIRSSLSNFSPLQLFIWLQSLCCCFAIVKSCSSAKSGNAGKDDTVGLYFVLKDFLFTGVLFHCFVFEEEVRLKILKFCKSTAGGKLCIDRVEEVF